MVCFWKQQHLLSFTVRLNGSLLKMNIPAVNRYITVGEEKANSLRLTKSYILFLQTLFSSRNFSLMVTSLRSRSYLSLWI